MNNPERKSEGEGRTDVKGTFYLNRSAHFVDQCFDDGHTKTGAFVLCAGIRFFLSKRLEQFFFYEGLRYTNAGIPDHKFIDCSCIIERNFAGISINASARLVVFDGVAEQVSIIWRI